MPNLNNHYFSYKKLDLVLKSHHISVCRNNSAVLIFATMLKSDIKAILFDLDGTLIQSALDIQTSVNLTLESYGFEPISYDECVDFIGDGVDKLIRRSFAAHLARKFNEHHLTEAVIKFREIYAEHLTDTTQPYPGVRETLAELQPYILAVISNKPYRFTVRILEKLNIAHHFKYVLGGDSLPVHKPDPGQILYIMQQSQLNPSEILMVGDSENDILAAHAIAAPVVAVTYGFRSENALKIQKPDYLINEFADLLKILG